MEPYLHPAFVVVVVILAVAIVGAYLLLSTVAGKEDEYLWVHEPELPPPPDPEREELAALLSEE